MCLDIAFNMHEADRVTTHPPPPTPTPSPDPCVPQYRANKWSSRFLVHHAVRVVARIMVQRVSITSSVLELIADRWWPYTRAVKGQDTTRRAYCAVCVAGFGRRSVNDSCALRERQHSTFFFMNRLFVIWVQPNAIVCTEIADQVNPRSKLSCAMWTGHCQRWTRLRVGARSNLPMLVLARHALLFETCHSGVDQGVRDRPISCGLLPCDVIDDTEHSMESFGVTYMGCHLSCEHVSIVWTLAVLTLWSTIVSGTLSCHFICRFLRQRKGEKSWAVWHVDCTLSMSHKRTTGKVVQLLDILWSSSSDHSSSLLL